MGRDRREGNRKEKRGGRRSRDLKVEEGAWMCRRGGRRSRDLQERWKKEHGCAGKVEEGASHERERASRKKARSVLTPPPPPTHPPTISWLSNLFSYSDSV